VDTSVNVDGVLTPLARGEGGKTNKVCVAEGVGWDAVAVHWDASEVETPDKAVLIGKGTNEDSLADGRRDREEDAEEIMLGDAEMIDDRWEEVRRSVLSTSTCTDGKGITGVTSFSGGGLRFSFLSGEF